MWLKDPNKGPRANLVTTNVPLKDFKHYLFMVPLFWLNLRQLNLVTMYGEINTVREERYFMVSVDNKGSNVMSMVFRIYQCTILKKWIHNSGYFEYCLSNTSCLIEYV